MSSRLILALDTAAPYEAVALVRDQAVLLELRIHRPRGRDGLIAHPIAALAEQVGAPLTGLTHVVVTHGPGAFSGVRVGMALAAGLARGAGAELLSVSTTRARALWWAGSAHPVLALLDARRGQFYAGAWERGGEGRELLPPTAARLDELLPSLAALPGPLAVTGCGADPARAQLLALRDDWIFAPEGRRSGAAGQLGLWCERALRAGRGPHVEGALRPVYLRSSQAETNLSLRARD